MLDDTCALTCLKCFELTAYQFSNSLDWVLSHWVHFTVHSLDLFVFISILCFFHTAYMFCYCQHSGVDLMGLKPSP